MCVGFWSLDNHDYSLVLCTNRDEYLSRPTEPAHWHSFESIESPIVSKPSVLEAKPEPFEGIRKGKGAILSGIDIFAGGTWFGINKRGEVALLTNITEPYANLPSSRGYLCSSFLRRNESLTNTNLCDFVNELTASDTQYSGFNVLLLAPSHSSCGNSPADNDTAHNPFPGGLHYDAAFLSNGGAGNPIIHLPMSEQSRTCGGISNSVSDGVDPFTGLQTDSEWAKVVQGRHLLADILANHESEDVLVEALFKLLRNKTHSPPTTRQEFQETILIDPVDLGGLRRGPSFAQTYQQAQDVSSTASNGRQGTTVLSSEAAGHDETSPRPKYYATRLSTVLLVRRNGEVLFIERDVWLSGNGAPYLAEHNVGHDRHERRYHFRL